MPWGAIISAGASLLGGMGGSSAAGSAADAQNAASAGAIAEQQRQYDQNRKDQAPWRDAGSAAVNRLKFLLGLGGGSDGTTGQTAAQIRQNLLPQYTSTSQTLTGWRPDSATGGDSPTFLPGYPIYSNTQSVDENALQAAINNELAKQPSGTTSDPAYGSLTRNFTMADRDADPVYQSGLQFGLDQGNRGINERAIANGGYDSGATLKALTRFGNDYGSTKAEGAYNRFNTNNTNLYNRLAGVSGTGQTATAQTNQDGTATAGNIANLMTGMGNSTAAGIVGGANAMSNGFGGVSSAINGYQNQQILRGLMGNRGGSTSGGYSYTPGDAFSTGIDFSGMY